MKVAIFSPYRTVAPHFETELEIARTHLDAGDSVEYFGCSGELQTCDFNAGKNESVCAECCGRRLHGLNTTDRELAQSATGNRFQSSEREFPPLTELEQLIEFRIGSFDIGYAALSSLVSILRDPDPDLIAHQPLLQRILHSAHSVYQTTLDFIATRSLDAVYVFNGRFAMMRAVLRACQETGVDCLIHERGCDNHHYDVVKNHLPHDIEKIEAIIRAQWESAPVDTRTQVADDWFSDRVARVEKNWKSFVKGQARGRLPDSWNARRRNVSIFCSSDDEFVAIGDCWTNHLYENQVVAIRRICESLIDAGSNTMIHLRVHPNLTDVENERKQEMLDLDYPNLSVIPPDSPVDTYQLMSESDTVVSFGSSVGIEAVFHNRPSILLGPCFYRGLGGTYQPQSHDEVVALIQQELSPLSKEGARMYAYWLQTRGRRYRYYEPLGFFEGRFKGEQIYDQSSHTQSPRSFGGKLKRELGRIAQKMCSVR